MHPTIKSEAKRGQAKTVRWALRKGRIMVTYSKMCHEGVSKDWKVVEKQHMIHETDVQMKL